MKKYTVGVDFGTLSARALLLDTASGREVADFGVDYPHAVMDKTLPDGTPLPQGFALQHPSDYIYALSGAVKGVLEKGGVSPNEVAAFGFDFTACTVIATDENGTPLCLDKRFENNPHAYVKLWKHIGAVSQGERITGIARARKEKFLLRYGDKVSAEWFFPKVLETLECAPEVYENTATFSEAADWLTFKLTGNRVYSSAFAGFKSLWCREDGFPSPDFFEAVHPELKNIIGTKVSDTFTDIDGEAGVLNEEGAKITGLPVGIPVSVPQLDAHASIPGFGVTTSGKLLLVLGTSSVHMVLSDVRRDIKGICGYVSDSVIRGLVTYEAGQICCGDHFSWFVKNSVPESYSIQAREKGVSIYDLLNEKASGLRVGESGLVALDWFNGNRCVLSDSNLTGVIAGLTLRTTPEEIYRALVEATAFGTRVILENYEKGGIPITDIIAGGGIAVKSPFVAQLYADVIGKPITVAQSTQSAALGSAMYAACSAGIFDDLTDASKTCVSPSEKIYTPIPENVSAYNKLYNEFLILHDIFGIKNKEIMRRLKTI